MPNLVMSGAFAKQQLEKDVRALAFEFLSKLSEDDTSPGLHIEPINKSADPRVRTGRVNLQFRAVVYKLGHENGEPTYLFAGVWNHDDAIAYAKSHVLRVNPVNGVAELIQESQPDEVTVESAAPAATTLVDTTPILKAKSYFPSDLTEGFGLPRGFAEHVLALVTEEDVRKYAATLPTTWHADVLDGMLAGMTIDDIKSALGLILDEPEDVEDENTVAPVPGPELELRPEQIDESATEDEQILAALKHPAARAQWRFIEDNAELRDIIDSGDLAGWRVFLHPEQRRYVERDYNGAFRLTGGAGTGKTVVLLHRARRLALADPGARVVLTTFTRQLASNLQRDLERLDPEVRIAGELGEPGVLIRGIDQLAMAVRKLGGGAYNAEGAAVVGEALSGSGGSPVGNGDGWDDAIAIAGGGLPHGLQSAQFLEAEYLQVILPNRITSLDQYRKIRRPGRGVMLDRAKRDAVWAVVDRQRRTARLSGKLPFADAAEIGAAHLEKADSTPADHVLVDEGQDLTPSHWKLLRRLVATGRNDLFLAEDSHQRIYGQRVVLSRYGIAIRGRSRRLSLNYRTTAENLRYAFTVLEGGQYIDPEGNHEGLVGPYRSARSGPPPQIIAAPTSTGQLAAVAAVINEWIDNGVPAASIAVLTATRAAQLQEKLSGAGVAAAEPKGDAPPVGKVVVLTMHKAKGLEFSRVVLYDVSEGSFPPPASLKNALAEDLPELLSKARSLLYVAASRARDELVVTYQGNPSELLQGP
jgi:hypothetical protein